MMAKRCMICLFSVFCVTFFSSLPAKRKKPGTRIAPIEKRERPQRMADKKEGKTQKVARNATGSSVKKVGRQERMRQKRKGEWSWFGNKKTISTMTFQELKKNKEELVAAGNKESAIKYMEKMIPLCTDMHDLENIMIELGDLYYETGKLAKAYTMYREFVNLYPGSQKVEYALYRAIVCKFDEIGDADRDQTQTKDTVSLCLEFLERSDLFTTHKKDVDKILAQCRQRLFENESTIFNFYLFNGRHIAANKRLELMRKEFVELMPELESDVLNLEIELAQAAHNDELLDLKKQELISKFPDETSVVLAQADGEKDKKKHFASRF